MINVVVFNLIKLETMLASLMVHSWATPLNLSAPIAGILTIGGFMGYYSLSRKF
tara:strand:+ start:86 stop:247 length:162 start_codon:yes stop_codon:yes gene_type:complete